MNIPLLSVSSVLARVRPPPWAYLLLALAASGRTLEAQRGPVLTVAEVRRDADGDFVPDRIGQTVDMVGVATREPRKLRGSRFVMLQDSTGAIRLYPPRDTLLLRGVRAGDLLAVRGRVAQYRGFEELLVTEVHKVGSTTVPPPRDVLVVDLHQERFSGRLVRVTGVLERVPRPGDAPEYRIRDRTGVTRISIPSRFFNDPQLVERLMRGGAVEVVGIASQMDDIPPFDSGYYLLAREPEDLRFAPVPPYRRMAVAGIILAFALLVLYLLARRRSAERRAREMTALSEELRRSEEALRASEKRFRSLIENAQDVVTVLDAEGNIVFESTAVERTLGYLPEELIGTNPLERVHPEEFPAVREAFGALLREPGGTRAFEFRTRGKDGSWRVLESIGHNALEDPAVAGIVLNSRDITDRRAAEKALESTQQQLLQSQKMEAVGRLAGGVAHDFNNLLTVIKGSSEFLLEDLPSDHPSRQDVEEIKDAADRAARLTHQLLAFSRKQVLQPRILNLNVVVAEMRSMLRRLIGEDIDLITDLDPELGRVEADPGQVEQILLNLAINARDAMPNGGKLILETRGMCFDEHAEELYPHVPPGTPGVLLAVSDTGQGMPKEIRERVFEPFFTTKEPGKGTGLGLSTVYGIVKQSGGYIWVDSEVGHGTTVRVYLPRVDSPTVHEETAQESQAERLCGTILLVEDEDAVRSTARRVLERHAYRVLAAGAVEEALAICAEHDGPIDLLVTYVVMPRMNGREVSERARALRPDMKVLFMSGYTDEAIVHHGVLDPGVCFLQKPFSRDDLTRMVGELLGELQHAG